MFVLLLVGVVVPLMDFVFTLGVVVESICNLDFSIILVAIDDDVEVCFDGEGGFPTGGFVTFFVVVLLLSVILAVIVVAVVLFADLVVGVVVVVVVEVVVSGSTVVLIVTIVLESTSFFPLLLLLLLFDFGSFLGNNKNNPNRTLK